MTEATQATELRTKLADAILPVMQRLEAEIAAARQYAEEMRGFCSPHGVSVHYADQLVEAMDRAREEQSG